jgi:transposase
LPPPSSRVHSTLTLRMEAQLMRRNRARPAGRRTTPSLLERINPDVAGIDCGASQHFVAVPPDRAPQPVRSFGVFTPDLVALAEWLKACGVRSVAMEATGVYWIALFEMLEARGFEVLLVNARHVRNVPGRKSDVEDCEWLRELHSVGLLRGSFRPRDEVVALRGYVRHRDTLVQTTSDFIRRMQSALVQMNLHLSVVLTDITGVTGMAILRSIVAGQRDPHELARHRHPRCKATHEEIVAALSGSYRPEHLFILQQNLELYDLYQQKIAACDDAIEAHLARLRDTASPPTSPLPARRRRLRRQGNEPAFDIRSPLYALLNVDLSQIDGLGPYTALRLVSEIGTDMSRWPSERHFTSWLGLAPQNRVSGGALLSSRTPASANRAAAMLRMIALAVARTDTALGAFYRRLAARISKPKALTATARKIAILVYKMLRGELEYADPGADAYHTRQRDRALRSLRRRASSLGFDLIEQHAASVVS